MTKQSLRLKTKTQALLKLHTSVVFLLFFTIFCSTSRAEFIQDYYDGSSNSVIDQSLSSSLIQASYNNQTSEYENFEKSESTSIESLYGTMQIFAAKAVEIPKPKTPQYVSFQCSCHCGKALSFEGNFIQLCARPYDTDIRQCLYQSFAVQDRLKHRHVLELNEDDPDSEKLLCVDAVNQETTYNNALARADQYCANYTFSPCEGYNPDGDLTGGLYSNCASVPVKQTTCPKLTTPLKIEAPAPDRLEGALF